MTFLDDLLGEAEDTKPSSDVQVSLGGKLLTVRCYQIGGIQWADITARNPARPESPIDRRYGYNWQAAALKAAPLAARLIEGDEEVKYPAKTWADLFDRLPGSDVTAFCSAIWALNQWDPEQRIEALKKASTADSEKS